MEQLGEYAEVIKAYAGEYAEIAKFYAEHTLEVAKTYLPNDEKELEWWVRFRSYEDILKKHESLLTCEIVFYMIAFLTFFHAIKAGGRYKWLWLSAVVYILGLQCVSYWLPDTRTAWHAQGQVMLLGHRLPLHVLLGGAACLYIACVAVAHMNLRWWAEPFAVGLSSVLLAAPCETMAVKLLWKTYHSSDPSIADRTYGTPWMTYFYIAAFASSFSGVFFGQRGLLCQSSLRFQSAGFFCELPMLLLTAAMSFLCGVLQVLPVFHPLHDTLGVSTEAIVAIVLGAHVLIVWCADRCPEEASRTSTTRHHRSQHPPTLLQKMRKDVMSLLPLALLLHYSFSLLLVFTVQPDNIRATGFHQPVGDCDSTVQVLTPFGHTLTKHRYLCAEKLDEEYFDLKCLKTAPKEGKSWYTICGKPYSNQTEHQLVVSMMCAVGLVWFYQLFYRSGPQPRTRGPRVKQHRD